MSLLFTVHGRPVPQGNHRATRQGRIYETSKGHAQWRRDVTHAAVMAMAAQCSPRITGPIELCVIFYFARPPSHLKKDGGLRKGKPEMKISSPDLSKLVRCAEDALTDAGVWEDDSRVVSLRAHKVYGSSDRCSISVLPCKGLPF